MATIEELRKKLYSKEEIKRERKEWGFLRGLRRSGGEPKTFWGGQDFEVYKKRAETKRGRRWPAAIVIFSLVMLLGIAIYISYEIFFVSEEVTLTIVGPDGVENGERSDFAAFIKNTGTVDLSDVELNITYPEEAIPLQPTGEAKTVTHEKVVFGKVAVGGEIKHDIAIRFLGRTGDERIISVLVVYRPENIQSRLTKKASFAARITRSPFIVTISAPEEVSPDQRLEVAFTVNSEAKSVFNNVSFRVDYPEGFEFESADPVPTRDKNIWSLGDLAPGQAKKFLVRGTIRGQPEEIKAFNSVIGQFKPETKEWLVYLEEARGPKMASPFLFIRQEMNGQRDGVINPGESARFSIFYKNNLSKKINNIVITARISEEVVSLTALRVEGGAHDPANHEIRWTASTLPELKEVGPGESGTVSFSVNLRPSPPLRTFSDKNFLMDSKVSIDTKTIPEEFRGVKLRYEDRISFKINTKLTLNTRTTYFDSPVKNTGPLPPRVRQETAYTIFWQLANQSNDALNVEVKGGLPPNVKWLGTVGDVPGTAMFNAASGEVVWSIPRIGIATGILKPQLTLVFRVLLIPGEDQIGISPILVSKITAEGIDSFTNERLHDEKEHLTTELQTDTVRDFEQWKVAP